MRFNNPAFEPLSESESDDENTVYERPKTPVQSTRYGTLQLMESPINDENMEEIELTPLNQRGRSIGTQTLSCWGDPYGWRLQRKYKVAIVLTFGSLACIALYYLIRYLAAANAPINTTTFATSTSIHTGNPTTHMSHSTAFETTNPTTAYETTTQYKTTEDTTAWSTRHTIFTTPKPTPDPRCVINPECCDPEGHYICKK